MNLSGMRLETQHLVIASTIDYTFSHLDHVIVIIPEAWESIPQGKMTPVKWVAQQFIRKGAAIGNYMFLDSQDIGGIDKTPLRQCDNWLMGRMKEAHEVERILKQLLGMKVPAEEIQTLSLGHFYAAIGNMVKKVYVLPVGVPEQVGVAVACGKRTPESVRDEFIKVKVMESDEMYKEQYEEEKRKREEYEKTITQLKDEKATLETELKQLEALKTFGAALENFLIQIGATSLQTTVIDLEHRDLVVNIHHEGEKEVKMSTSTKEGQMMYCIVNEMSREEEGWAQIDLIKKLLEHGWNIKQSTVSVTLSKWVPEGLLIKTEKGYRLPTKVKFNIKKED
jgi:hypothetical protein